MIVIASVLTTPLLTKIKVIFAYTHIAFTLLMKK